MKKSTKSFAMNC